MDLAGEMAGKAEAVAGFVKGLANPHRLLILCALSTGERSVSELIAATGLAQTSMSQHLAKLRGERIVEYRRDHRTLYYRIVHPAVSEIIAVLYANFCGSARS